jgi:hypothetical protein
VFFCCTSMFCTHVLFATEFFCLGFYNLFSSMDRNLILHPNKEDTIRLGKVCDNLYHIPQILVYFFFCFLTYSIDLVNRSHLSFSYFCFFGGRRGNRTPKPFTASRFQGGVLVHSDFFRIWVIDGTRTHDILDHNQVFFL